MEKDEDLLIDHEVKLRVMKDSYDERLDDLENSINHIDKKLNRIIRYVICSIIIPVLLHNLNYL